MPITSVAPASVNINQLVWVKLTDHGVTTLSLYYNDEQINPHMRRQPDECRNGWWSFQLWELMSIFGAAMYNGADACFEKSVLHFTKPEEA